MTNLVNRMRYLIGIFLFVVMVPSLQAKSITRHVLDKVVEFKCHAALDESKIWKSARYLMANETAERKQQQICDCVAEHALNDANATQILKASFDEEEKQQLIQSAVRNSLKHCTGKVLGIS